MEYDYIVKNNGGVARFDSVKAASDFFNIQLSNASKYFKENKSWKGYEFIKKERLMDIDDSDEFESIKWHKNKNGELVKGPANYCNFLKTNVKYKDKIKLNEMSELIEYDGRTITDSLLNNISFELSELFNGLSINEKDVFLAVSTYASENSYHPIRTHIQSIKWDGIYRAEEFFIKFLGAKDTPLNRKFTKELLYNAYGRLVHPKKSPYWDYDVMTLLVDTNQGTGKTKILERLSYHKAIEVRNVGEVKEMVNNIRTGWFAVINELNCKKYDMDQLKNIVGASTQNTRPVYKRCTEEYVLHNVFVATTNNEYFLRDYTSDFERRFHIIECSGTRHSTTWWNENLPNSYIDQLWAEVITWYNENPNNPELRNLTPEEEDELKLIQQRHKSSNNDTSINTFIDTVTVNEFLIERECRDSYHAYSWNGFMDEFTKKGTVSMIRPVEMKAIPVNWIMYRFQGKPEGYIESIFNKKGWEKKVVKYYNGNEVKCFVSPDYKLKTQITQTEIYDDIARNIENGDF